MNCKHSLNRIISLAIFALALNARAAEPAPRDKAGDATAAAIRAEACRANDDPIGHALPLAAHWNTGAYPPEDTFDPHYQLQLIEQGHHLMPFLSMPGADSKPACV